MKENLPIPQELKEEAEARYVLLNPDERDDYDNFDGINQMVESARAAYIESALTSSYVQSLMEKESEKFAEWIADNEYVHEDIEGEHLWTNDYGDSYFTSAELYQKFKERGETK